MPPTKGREQEAPRGCGHTLAYGLPGCGVLLSRRCPGLLTVQGGQHSAGIALLRLPLATSHRGLPISQQALCPLFCSSVWGKVNPKRQLVFRAWGPSEVLGGKMAVGEPL